MTAENLIKVTTTVTRLDSSKSWWPTGDHSDINWYNSIRLRYLWPGYLLKATDLFGAGPHSPRIDTDQQTMTWTWWWYNHSYYQRWLADTHMQTHVDTCKQHWQSGFNHLETVNTVSAKTTSSGYSYVGDNYWALVQYNTNTY